jgi:transposase-like protein
MAFHMFLFFLLLCLAWLWHLYRLPHHPPHPRVGAIRTKIQRLLKPRTPLDCPACRLSSTLSSGAGPAPLPVRPWREVKSRRGATKRIDTAGFACPNQQCPYFGITDAHIHALVGDGKHGQAERIQTFRCQACHTTFTARRHTPLYRLKTPSQQIAVVLSALAEGLDLSAAERVAGLPTGDHHHLADSRRGTCTSLARALLPQPSSSAPAVGRTPHQATQRQAGAVALAGHRPHYEASSRAPYRSAHAEHGIYGDPFPARALGTWLHPDFHQ